MPENTNVTQITPPRVAITDPRTGNVSREWYRWFYYLYELIGTRGIIQPKNGGTGTGTIPSDGQLLVGDSVTNAYRVTDLGTGPGIAKTIGHGTLSIENTGVLSNIAGTGISVDQATGDVTITNTGVLSVSGGATGLTPTSPTTGDVTLDGTLNTTHGGTGQTSYTDGQLLIGNSTGNTLAKSTLTAGSGVTITNGAGSITISATGTGGDVVGPATATDNAIARFDGTTGKLIQNSPVTIDDAGSIIGADSLQFSGTIPATQPIGTMWFDGSTDTLNFQQNNITQQIGEELFVYGRAAENITNGQVIVVSGSYGTTGVVRFEPAPIGTTDQSTIIGIATEDIAKNSFGRITAFGTVHDLNTSAYADGDVLWYDPTVLGGYTDTQPSAPNIKCQVGIVTKAAGGTNGSIQVKVLPGSTLGGTDSNVQFGTLANGDLIQYNTSLGYWTNNAPSTITVGTATNADNVKTVSTATNANYYITFVDSNNGTAAYEAVYTDAGITYNPSTNALTSGVSGGTF